MKIAYRNNLKQVCEIVSKLQSKRVKDQIKLKRFNKRPQLIPLEETEMDIPFSHQREREKERERGFECCRGGPENKRIARKPGVASHRPELAKNQFMGTCTKFH